MNMTASLHFCRFAFFGAGVVSCVAGRVSARRPTPFSLLRQRKVSKRKATRVRVSLRCAKGNLRCSQQAGSLQTRLSPQTCNLPYPPVAALLGTRTREGEGTSPVPAPHPCGCAEQRREARKERSACLSPQGEFADSPRFASSAGCPAAQRRGRRHQGRLSFGHLSLAKQRKVPRLPGRDPACHASSTST